LELNKLLVATYERGVEDETLACGTGVTAAALAYFLQYSSLENGTHSIAIEVKGGNLKVNFDYNDGLFSEIWLCGPAVKVFEGKAFIEY
jgi:diaminopimelate epimerase